jgi:hypothetical protein
MRRRGLTKQSPAAELLATFHIPFAIGAAFAIVAVAAALFLRRLPREARADAVPDIAI